MTSAVSAEIVLAFLLGSAVTMLVWIGSDRHEQNKLAGPKGTG